MLILKAPTGRGDGSEFGCHDRSLPDGHIVVVLRTFGTWSMQMPSPCAWWQSATHGQHRGDGKRGALHLADLGKAGSHIRNRAVMLAELLSWPTAVSARDICVHSDKRLREPGQCGCPVPRVCHPLVVAVLAVRHSHSRRASTASGPTPRPRSTKPRWPEIVVRQYKTERPARRSARPGAGATAATVPWAHAARGLQMIACRKQ